MPAPKGELASENWRSGTARMEDWVIEVDARGWTHCEMVVCLLWVCDGVFGADSGDEGGGRHD